MHNRYRIPFIVGLGTLLLAVVVSMTGSRASTAKAMERTPLGIILESGCDHHCRPCGDNKHDIVVAQINRHSSSHLENCNTGSCDSHECGETLRAQEIWAAALTAEGDKLVRLLAENKDVATYNPDRQSLQLRCEKGNIIASLPLSETQLQALAAAE